MASSKAKLFVAMGMQEASSSRSNVMYKKNGAEIKESLKEVIKEIQGNMEGFKSDVSKLCKVREIDVKEVFEAGTDREEVENYTTKAYSNVPTKANSVLKELQKDLDEIQNLVSAIEYGGRRVEYFSRVSNNIESDRSFDLTYNELSEFGF